MPPASATIATSWRTPTTSSTSTTSKVNLRHANAAATRVYGYTLDEIRGMNISQIVDPSSLGIALESMAARIRGEVRTEPYELLTRTRDGTPVWVEVNARVLFEDGKPAAVEGIARDMTRRKRAEDALRDQSRRDSLTGTLNHGAANDELRKLLEQTRTPVPLPCATSTA